MRTSRQWPSLTQRLVQVGTAFILLAAWQPSSTRAATLPTHAPLRILVVSDEVNPHALPPASLTQPGEISAALLMPGSGLTLDAAPDAVLEIATDDVALATPLLSVSRADPAAYDVLVYFSHRGAADAGAQAAFTAAVEAFLVAGGSVVSFHHGSYGGAGKSGMQELIGATASGAVPWDTVDGQDVINVRPGHFVTENEIEYPSTKVYTDPALGIPAASYAFFNNTPDERYPTFTVNGSAGIFTLLFASDYVDNGATHLLGFVHRQPSWAGVVVGIQPGEYQPNALDDLEGNSFQILANAIYFAAYGAPPEDAPALNGPPLFALALALAAFGAFQAKRPSPARRSCSRARSLDLRDASAPRAKGPFARHLAPFE